jgi:hypothetical protein
VVSDDLHVPSGLSFITPLGSAHAVIVAAAATPSSLNMAQANNEFSADRTTMAFSIDSSRLLASTDAGTDANPVLS